MVGSETLPYYLNNTFVEKPLSDRLIALNDVVDAEIMFGKLIGSVMFEYFRLNRSFHDSYVTITNHFETWNRSIFSIDDYNRWYLGRLGRTFTSDQLNRLEFIYD